MVNIDRAQTGPRRAWAGLHLGRVGPALPGHVSLTGVTMLRVRAPTGPLVHQAWLTMDSHAWRMDRRTGS
jgi:sulfite reductase beta subunit-like hemoprotein